MKEAKTVSIITRFELLFFFFFGKFFGAYIKYVAISFRNIFFSLKQRVGKRVLTVFVILNALYFRLT